MDDWQITSQRPGSAGYINVVMREYERPDGTTATWDIVEDADAAAVRELLEETGYRGTTEIVASCWLMASSTRRQYVAVARDCVRAGEPVLSPEELCEPVVVSFADFRTHIRSGQLTDTDLAYLALDHLGLLGEPSASESAS
jgi:8-oxo-dGTP pyrophosphatase MutT (NUDIX family)